MEGERNTASHRSRSSGVRKKDRASLRGTAVVAAAAVLFAFTACTTTGTSRPALSSQYEVRGNIDAGLDLYESGEFVMSARRFRDASAGAADLSDRLTQRDATTAECVSWLRARRLDELSECTLRLEKLQRRQMRTDPGVNTLMAVGAIAGGRPTPPFRIPQAVHPIVRAAAKETQ